MSFAYLPLFTGDYLRDTRHLTPLRHGIYLLSLMHCWDSKGPMPLDEQECAGICNCRSVDEVEALRYILGKYFVRMVDGHYNRRMAQEVERSEAISGARSEAGKKGWQAKAKQLLSKSQASDSIPIPIPTLSPALAHPQDGGAPPNPPAPTAPSGRVAKKTAPKPVSGEVWAAYSKAYALKYGVEPIRNASVNGQLAHVVAKLGAGHAPAVAEFFLSHRNALYVNAMHPVTLLLRDAEKLHTEWLTGKTVTSAQARMVDQTQTNANAFAPMLERAEREKNAKS